MSTAVQEKYGKLIELLHKKTTDGTLIWSYEEFSEEVATTVAERIVTLSSGKNSDREPIIRVEISSPGKVKKEIFDDEYLTNFKPKVRGFDSFYSLMDSLRDMAIRAATNADEDIDAIINELDDPLF